MIPTVELTFEATYERRVDINYVNSKIYSPVYEWAQLTVTEKCDFDRACFLINEGEVTIGEYTEALYETDFANALITLVSGLRGTYATCKDGSVSWSDEDVEFFDSYMKPIIEKGVENVTGTWEDFQMESE